MDSPTRTSASRLPAVAWAAAVLVLLVLPPALSAGQDAGDPATDPPAAQPIPPQPPATPPQGGQQGPGGGEATNSGQDDGQPASEEPPQPTSTAVTADASATPVRKDKAKAAGSLTVSIGDNFYSPASVSIDVGDTITWRNNGVAQHSATANDGSFDTGVFGPGGSRSVTFSDPGTFNYFCTVHGNAQSGTVTVASTGGGDGGGGPSEAAAVASDGAAGSSSALPSTGSDTLPPMVVGLLLLAAGLTLRFRNWFGPV